MLTVLHSPAGASAHRSDADPLTAQSLRSIRGDGDSSHHLWWPVRHQANSDTLERQAHHSRCHTDATAGPVRAPPGLRKTPVQTETGKLVPRGLGIGGRLQPSARHAVSMAAL